MKKVVACTLTVVAALLVAAAFGGPARAQTQLAGYNLRGSMGLGPRMVDEDRNKEKYKEDHNLFSGFRLFDFFLTGEAPEGEGKPFDYFRLEGASLGGDPFPSGSLRVGKRNLYDFRVALRRAEYRYNNRNDTRAFSSLVTSPDVEFIGDPDIFQWDRDFADVDLILHPENWPRLTLSYRRQEQTGDSLTTRRLSRAAFSLFEPIDKVTNEYRVAVDHRLGPVDVTLEQAVRLWNNDMTVFLVRPTSGGELGSSDRSGLSRFRWHQSETITNPVTRVRLHAVPWSRLEVNTGYVFSRTSANHSVDNFINGTTARQDVVSGRIIGSGDGDRDTHLFDAGFSFRILDNLFFHNTYRFYSSLGAGKTRPTGPDAVIGFLNLEEEGNRITKTDTDIKGNTLRAFFEYLPWQNLTLRFGYGWQDRRARLVRAFGSDPFDRIPVRDVVTRDNNVIAGFHFRPLRVLSVLGEYETLSVDNPFTEISASDAQRAKVRIQVQPLKSLGMNLDYQIKTRKNTGGTPDFGVPTVEPQRFLNQGASDIDEKNYSASLWWRPLKGLTLNASYMRQDLDFNTEIESFFNRVPRSETANFSEDNEIFQGSALYKITSSLSTSFRYSFVNATGTFPLSSSDYALGALYTFKLLGTKMGLDLNFRRVRLDERGEDAVERFFPEKQAPAFRIDNDYKADLWTVMLRVELE